MTLGKKESWSEAPTDFTMKLFYIVGENCCSSVGGSTQLNDFEKRASPDMPSPERILPIDIRRFDRQSFCKQFSEQKTSENSIGLEGSASFYRQAGCVYALQRKEERQSGARACTKCRSTDGSNYIGQQFGFIIHSANRKV
ncbi:MarR family transcriptional regulator [Anopheles sinensis]|uniref:MarR family transcriptional regulator n=1 Tax=Anopheles sinensis TaxID=74873 RepID=A0A084W1S2_ANOSI|nr:MarR family transcriptional regulator [Anopheles sinensis]